MTAGTDPQFAFPGFTASTCLSPLSPLTKTFVHPLLPLKSSWKLGPFHLRFSPQALATLPLERHLYSYEAVCFGKTGQQKDDSKQELETLQICSTSRLLPCREATAPLIFETRTTTEAPVGLFFGSEILGPFTGYLKDKQTACSSLETE